jgi:hypothetical protein
VSEGERAVLQYMREKKDQRHTYIRTHFIVMKLELFFFVSGLRGIFSSLSYFGYHHSTASANKSERTHGGENVVKKLIILSLLFFFFLFVSFRLMQFSVFAAHTNSHGSWHLLLLFLFFLDNQIRRKMAH